MKLLIVLLISIIFGFTICEELLCEKIGKKFEADIRSFIAAKDFEEVAKHLNANFTYETYDYKDILIRLPPTYNKSQFMDRLKKDEIKIFGLPEDKNEMIECRDDILLVFREVRGKLSYRYFLSENKQLKAGFELTSLEQSVLN